MEVNQIYNREIKEYFINAAIGILMQNDLMKEEDLRGLSVSMGYLFSTDEGQIEGLYCVAVAGTEYFFAAQKGKLMMVNINRQMFEQTIEYMKANHPCILNDELPETPVQKKRREKNNKIVGKMKIAVAERVMTRWNDDEVNLRSVEEICRRAVACFFAIQIACDINKGNYEEGLNYFKPLIDKFGVADQLNSKESRILDGSYSMQDAIDMDWAYEALWSLFWCLGLVKDISDGSGVCDCDKVIKTIMNCGSVSDLVKKSKLRKKEEILDMLDLFFRYNWAINDAKVNPASSIGNLNPSTVIERRRGLEWVVSDVEDWYDLSMGA